MGEFKHDKETPNFNRSEGDAALRFEDLRLDVQTAHTAGLDRVISGQEELGKEEARARLKEYGKTFVEQVRKSTPGDSGLSPKERACDILGSLRDTSYRCPHWRE